MKKITITKNRTVIGLICIVLAILVVFLISPQMNKFMSAKITVIRVAEDIKKGSVITDKMIEKVEIGKHGLADGIITDKSQIVGMYAKSDLYTSDYFTSAKISETLETAETHIAQLDGTKSAMSIPIADFAKGVSGKLVGGDVVSVIISTDDESIIPPELKYVEVIASTTASGIDTDDQENIDNAEDTLPATVTLLVNDKQAAMLRQNDEKGLHLTLVCRNENPLAKEFLKTQTEYFELSKEEGN